MGHTDDGLGRDLPCELLVPSDMSISRVGEGRWGRMGNATSFEVVPVIYTETRLVRKV